ncbi:MAG: RNA polymerase sigma factor [Myxococcota bacterium]|nr:RNA polymerase sigma factor [Myxococcota bacterium]
MVSDEELVDRLRAGDRASFDELYERYFPRVYRFVDRRLNNRADTEETVQEVFINLFSSVHGFRGDAPFAAWVFGLTRRTIAARFKRKRHEMVPLTSEDEDPRLAQVAKQSNQDDPLESYECNERMRQMGEVIEKDLTAEQWNLFRLHHLENRTIQEIAASVHKTEDSIKSHLYRARRLLLAR